MAFVFVARSWMWMFFFQAEDGIRDLTVTGVQTCARPIAHRRDGEVPPGAGGTGCVLFPKRAWASPASGQRLGRGVHRLPRLARTAQAHQPPLETVLAEHPRHVRQMP